MPSKVHWSEQVAQYVKSKAPEPRRELWQAIKGLADWDGREDLPKIRRLEDELVGYLRVRVGSHRVIFRGAIIDGNRTVAQQFSF